MRVQSFANPWLSGGIAAAVVLAVAVAAGSRLTIRTYDIPLKGSVERVAVPKSIAQYAPPAAAPAQAAASLAAPQIARTGRVSLFVENVDAAVNALSRLARSQGGAVFSLDVSNGDGSVAQPNGRMQLRIPAGRFDAAMNGIAMAGKVRERSADAQDLSGDLTDSSARLRNLRRTEADIRRIMDRSGNVSQVMDAENQLSQVREQIETLESDLKSMRGRVAYATIDVSMQSEASAAPVQRTAAAQLASVWHDAVSAFGQTAIGIAAILMWLVVFAPYALAALLAGWIVFRLRTVAANRT
jgi:hypothetical protein